MKLVLLEIPDEPKEWPKWLECHLIGLDLADLIAQLQAVLVVKDQSSQSLESICRGNLSGILEYGLVAMGSDQISMLLKHPQLLLELQEKVFLEGGEYWRTVPLTNEHITEATTGLPVVWKAIGNELPNKELIKSTSDTRPASRSWLFLATAAALFIAVGLWTILPSKAGWGFERSQLLSAKVTSTEFLLSLSDASGDWFNKRPTTKAELDKRLREFRRGCDTLIAAQLPQLANDDRVWLVQKCRDWAAKIDLHIAELAAGTKTIDQVLSDADDTVNKLKAALKAKASSVG